MRFDEVSPSHLAPESAMENVVPELRSANSGPDPRIAWPVARLAEIPELRSGRIDVFCIRVSDWLAALDELEVLLSEGEIARANRFHFPRDRERFVVQSGVLRRVLARHSGRDPETLGFATGPKGKPGLELAQSRAGSSLPGTSPITFNVSHSAGMVLVAVGEVVEIGVDVEAVRELPDMAGIVAAHFTNSEAGSLSRLAMAERTGAFYRIWTAKEAVLKATGDGIGNLLPTVEIGLEANGDPMLVRTPIGVPPALSWTLLRLDPAEGFVGTLAVPIQTVDLSTWWLRPE